jgi:hypothetical protein
MGRQSPEDQISAYNQRLIDALKEIKRLKGYRSDAELFRQFQLRTGIEVPDSTYSRWVLGQVAMPGWPMPAMATVFGYSLDELIPIESNRVAQLEARYEHLGSILSRLLDTLASRLGPLVGREDDQKPAPESGAKELIAAIRSLEAEIEQDQEEAKGRRKGM